MSATPTTNLSFQNFFSAQLTNDVSLTDTDIFIDTIPNGSEGFLVIDPDVPTKREIIYYTSKTGTKVVCPSVGDGRGQDDTAAATHTSGATVIMAPIAAYYETLLNLFNTTPQGWTSVGSTLTVASGYNKGNKEFVIDSSADLTAVLSPGMRFKLSRGTTAPTQCADFESSSSQYASKTSPSGITFTDDFTCEAWVKLESYTGSTQTIINRRNGSTEGFSFELTDNGRVSLVSMRIASNNRSIFSYQSIPLGRWVHIAASMDNSGNSHAIYIDGVSVPFSTVTNGTITALVQSSNPLRIGASDGPSGYLDAELTDVRIWSAVRTATQIRDNMSQQLTGGETNLVAYFKLTGDLSDSTANANNLTASGGVAATTSDNPMHNTEYGVITAVSASQITVFTGTDYVIPNMTLSTPYYSTQKTPFGFPVGKGSWEVRLWLLNSAPTTTSSTFNNSNSLSISVPRGDWSFGYDIDVLTNSGVDGVNRTGYYTLSTVTNAEQDYRLTSSSRQYRDGGHGGTQSRRVPLSLTVQTTYYFLARVSSQLETYPMSGYIIAECVYI